MEIIKKNHYIDTTIYKADILIRTLKSELKAKVDNLNIGITSEQFIVLDTICASKDIYPQKLSEILMKDKSNTTRILKILEQKGLIKKEVSSTHNRLIYVLKPTTKGEKLISDNMPQIKMFITDIFKNITDNEIENLHKLADKLKIDLFNSL